MWFSICLLYEIGQNCGDFKTFQNMKILILRIILTKILNSKKNSKKKNSKNKNVSEHSP